MVSTNCPNYHRLFFYWMKASRRRSWLLVAAARLSTCQSIVRFKAWRVSPSLPLAAIDSFGLDRPSTASIANFACQMEKRQNTRNEWRALVLKFCQSGKKCITFFLTYSWEEVVKVWWWHKLVNQAVQFPKANLEEKNYQTTTSIGPPRHQPRHRLEKVSFLQYCKEF